MASPCKYHINGKSLSKEQFLDYVKTLDQNDIASVTPFMRKKIGEFQSSHFDQPNILVHLRMNTRTDSEGKKVLFLEEIQSDYGQSGKREGFTKATPKSEIDAVSKYNTLINEKKKLLDSASEYVVNNKIPELQIKVDNVNDRIELARKDLPKSANIDFDTEFANIEVKKSIPPAPFVTDTNSWVKLGLKTALKEAVAQKADKIAWTTGEQQNDRYDLSKSVKRVDFIKVGEDRYKYEALDLNSKRIAFDDNGTTSLKDIESMFGKDIAEKVKADKKGDLRLEGDGLKVGGKGMKGFYGSPTEVSLGIVGGVAKKLFGQKLGVVLLKGEKPITKDNTIVEKGIRSYILKNNNGDSLATMSFETGDWFSKNDLHNELVFLAKKYAKKEVQETEQYSIDITPELKQAVKEGLPLFKNDLVQAKERLKAASAKLDALNRNLGIANDPEQIAKVKFEYYKALVDVAKAYIEEKIDNLKDFIAKLKEDAGDDLVNENKDAINDAWNEANGGKKKTVEDFKVESESKQPKQEKRPVEGKDAPETKKRKATQRVLKSDEYSEAFKEAITEKSIYYKTLPNAITDKEAEAFIDIQGEFDAESALIDFNNGMSSAVRFSVMQKLIDKYEAKGEYLRAAELAEKLYSTATDYGQGIQIFSTFPKLSKIGQVAIAKKNVNKQRDEFIKKTAKTTTKIAKEFKKINKESAEEALDELKKVIESNTKVKKEGSITDLPLGYGTKNKVFTREKYLKAKQRIRGMALSGVPLSDIIEIAGYHIEATGRDFPRFVRRMKADLGAKVKPYLKDAYDQARKNLIEEGYDKSLFLTDEEVDAQLNEQEGQKWKDKLEKAIEKKDEKEQKVAIKKLQEISKDEGVWGQYKESAVKKLRGMVLTNAEKDISQNPSLQQFTDGLVKNMRQKMAELLPEQPKNKNIPRLDIEIIGDAYKNLEKYKEVWEKTQAEFQEKYADEPEVLEAIDEYFGEILDKPFSDRMLERAISKGLKDIDKTIADLVIQHYTVVDNAKQTLTDKLVNDAGLTGEEANNLAKAVQRKFDEIATKKKQDILEKMFSKRERKKPAIRSMEGDLIKLSNLGAFRTDEIIEMYGEKMGFPKLTEQNIKEIERLSDIVQSTNDPIKKRRAVEDLLSYQAKIKGHSITELVTVIWYANVLSGYNTQIVNFGANAINTVLLYANAIKQNPKDARFIGRGLIQGIKRGWLESKETLKTGYSPIKSKAEVPQLLEREDFAKIILSIPYTKVKFDANVINYLKYVRRAMIAADVIFFEGQKEMRAYQMASKEAAKEAKLTPTVNQRNRAIELLSRSDRQVEIIQEQVEVESDNEIREINNSDATKEEKAKLIKQIDRDKPRRIFDLIEQQRSGDLIQETSEFAARGTFNYPPKGALGAIAGALNKMVEDVPVLRYSVPFTNIIANVANETIDYTPLAFTRLKKGGYTNFRREELTDQQRIDLTTKAIIGTTLMTTAFILTQIKGDDDEPLLEITSNGTGDYAKNATLREQGWQEYSFRFKKPNGEYTGWYSYQYSPLILGLGYIGHVSDLIKYKEEKDEDTIVSLMSKAAGLTTATLFQATYLDGFGDLLATILDPRSSGGTVDKAIQGALGAVKGVVVPNLFSQTSQSLQRVFGDYKKETRETLAGKVLQDIPYARDMYYDKINILGEPVKPDTDKFQSADEPNKIIQLLVNKKAVFAPINRKTEKIYDITEGNERILTDQEFFEYSKMKGQYIKDAIEKDFKKYKSMSDYKFKKELTKIKKKATEAARYSINGIDINSTKIIKNDVEYDFTPYHMKEFRTISENYKNTNTMVDLKNTKVKVYIETLGLTRKEAEQKAMVDISKSADKYAKNILWLRHLEAKDERDVLEEVE